MDNETNVVYKMLDFLRYQDDIKEEITKYQMSLLKKEDPHFNLPRERIKYLKNNLNSYS